MLEKVNNILFSVKNLLITLNNNNKKMMMKKRKIKEIKINQIKMMIDIKK
jgi:hypothetical protein